MSANSSINSPEVPASAEQKPRRYSWWLVFGLPLWVFAGFVVAQAVLVALFVVLQRSGVSFGDIDSSVLDAIFAACVYVVGMGAVIGLPWLVRRRRTTWKGLGLHRLPSWMDIGLAPAGFVLYLLASAVVTYGVFQLIPGFNPSEPQEVGFDNLTHQYEYILAFATLVVIAPIAEEILFRGYLYGKLRRAAPLWVAVAVTSVLFGLLHTQWTADGVAGLNVAVDVFVLSIVMCGLREVTGSIWAGILLHMLKNGLAFYLLFINPSLLSTIGG